SVVEFNVDVTPFMLQLIKENEDESIRIDLGSGRYQFGAVFQDCAGNLSEFLIIGEPPEDFPPEMTTYMDVTISTPQSIIADISGEEFICVDPDNEVVLTGSATHPDAQLIDPFVVLYFMAADTSGAGNGTYTSVGSVIYDFEGEFTHPVEDYETVDFTFTLTLEDLQDLAGTLDPAIIHFKSNAFGTGGLIEHSITGANIAVQTSDVS
ncbi:MAG: hypothetical protein GY869_24810, partial [Planctomycetes bacterium]|nr:hypothetical protein [Planctomycetota bacterium]